MIHNKINELAKLRNKANIRLQDLAYLFNINPITLVQMESGQKTPPLSIIATYHVLFGISFDELLSNLCAETHSYLYEKSTQVIEQLENSDSPKSQQRVQGHKRIVKLLNTGNYEELD